MTLVAELPAMASVTSWGRDTIAAKKIAEPGTIDMTWAMRESLKRDIRKHPADFVVFETETGAQRFVSEHRMDAKRETNERLISLGVVGYWRGKTLVVLPWEPVRN